MVALAIWTSIGMLWPTLFAVSWNCTKLWRYTFVSCYDYLWSVLILKNESEMSTNRVFSAIRCRRIGHLFAIKFHWNIWVDSSTSTNWDVYESGQMLCRFVDIDESGCLRIGTNVVSIRRHRRIGMSTNLAICESICYQWMRGVYRTYVCQHSTHRNAKQNKTQQKQRTSAAPIALYV